MVEFDARVRFSGEEDKREQYAKLQALGEAVKEALTAACEYAREHQLSFYFSPTYGMGGDYEGDARGWSPSSGSC